MFDFLFVLKTLFLTVVILILLQIRVGENTLEHQAMSLVQTSPLVQPLREVAQGSIKFVRNNYRAFANQLGEKKSSWWTSSDQPGHRGLAGRLERSKAYEEEKAERKRRPSGEDAVEE